MTPNIEQAARNLLDELVESGIDQPIDESVELAIITRHFAAYAKDLMNSLERIMANKPTGRRYKTVLALLKGEGFAKPFIAKYRKLSGSVLKDRSRKQTASAIDKQVTSRTNSKVRK